MASDLISLFPDAKIVLDPFMGSGTTALASREMNRQFIGFEIDEKYIDLANQRLSQLSLNL